MSEIATVIKYDGKRFLGLKNLCCDDVTDSSVPLPETLRKLYSAANVKNDFECLALLEHVFMLEVGFVPVDVPQDKWYEELPPHWPDQHGMLFYKICYSHQLCPDVLCQLSFIPLGSILTTHATILNREHQQHVPAVIQKDLYVNSKNGFEDPASVYRNVGEFARDFKYAFVYPFIQELSQVYEIKQALSLSDLPTDVKFHILSFLPAEGLVAMSCVNKEFHDIADSSFLWKPLYLCHFPKEVPSNTNESHKWKDLYADEYKKMKEIAKKYLPVAQPSHIPFDMDLRWPPPHIGIPPPIRPYPSYSVLPPEIKEAFPLLARRYQPMNPLLIDIIPPPFPPFF